MWAAGGKWTAAAPIPPTDRFAPVRRAKVEEPARMKMALQASKATGASFPTSNPSNSPRATRINWKHNVLRHETFPHILTIRFFSEEECRRAARGVGRMVQRGMGLLEKPVRLRDYKICNVLATCRLPFGVKIEEMAGKYKEAQYEPELSVGLVWKFVEPKASLRIHTTGSVTVTGGEWLCICFVSPFRNVG